MSASESDREHTKSERETGCPGDKSHTNAKSKHLFESVSLSPSPLSLPLCGCLPSAASAALLLAKLDALATLALWANLKCEHEAIHMHSLRNGRGELQLTCGYK